MGQDSLTKAVLRRFGELGLPPSLIDLGDFRDRFFLHRWVMFVRDGDKLVDVHLVQPRQDQKSCSRGSAGTYRANRGGFVD